MMTGVGATYESAIVAFSRATGAPDSLLHVHTGMIIFVAIAALTRRPPGSLIPFGAVALAELVNEALDALADGRVRWPDTISDVVNTLLWPAVLTVGIRLYCSRPRRVDAGAGQSSPGKASDTSQEARSPAGPVAR